MIAKKTTEERERLFQLYGRVLKGDKQAKLELKRLHEAAFPHTKSWFSISNKKDLHTMYLHLYR